MFTPPAQISSKQWGTPHHTRERPEAKKCTIATPCQQKKRTHSASPPSLSSQRKSGCPHKNGALLISSWLTTYPRTTNPPMAAIAQARTKGRPSWFRRMVTSGFRRLKSGKEVTVRSKSSVHRFRSTRNRASAATWGISYVDTCTRIIEQTERKSNLEGAWELC